MTSNGDWLEICRPLYVDDGANEVGVDAVVSASSKDVVPQLLALSESTVGALVDRYDELR